MRKRNIIKFSLLLGLGLSACAPERGPQDPSGQQNGAEATNGEGHQHGHGQTMHMKGSTGQSVGHGKGDHGMMADGCPMMVEGTTVSAMDTATGVAVVFTTKGDVVDLRQRIARMAEHQQKMGEMHQGSMHASMHSEKGSHSGAAQGDGARGGNPATHQHSDNDGCPCCAHGDGTSDGMMMKGDMHGKMHGKPIAKTIQVVEVEGGAQLVYTPKDESDLAALREQVRAKAQAMQEGKCPMMKGHGAGASAPEAAHDHAAPTTQH